MNSANDLHAGGAHRQSKSDPIGSTEYLETDVLIPLNTQVKAPGFAELFRAMMEKPRSELIETAATPQPGTLQLVPLNT